MNQEEEEKEINIPIIRDLIRISKKIKLPALGEFSLYNLLDIYGTGILKGTFSFRASSIAYSFFLALFPFLLFLLNLIPIIPIDGFQSRFLIFIEALLPAQTTEFFYPIIADIAVNPRAGLLSFVFFLSIFLSANGVNAIFSAFEYSFHVTINRSFFRQYFVALVVSIFLALLLLTSVGVILYGEYVIRDLQSKAYIDKDLFWISFFQFIVFLIMIYVVIATLYYYGTKEGKAISFFSIGAVTTTILFVVTTYLFGIYINNFSNYNELYGSIGALLILMLYIWINANLLLLGFELNVSIKRLKEKI
ncbi:YihY/virulence factor BrkB family protein [Aequorivita sp. F47161]|uniref:YihY/virulence factor BrkB family protein n=1 Tax=Aequorivita vitellina TaxID=2874475 RepID=A0A9X1QU82_9FLAO|nr:YihY/virulence factor BrkB family protein [Aequorivita vitellina]MCG2417894.1 YihY/virulence factor BrkB family protein [Aequorivita vitellina]MCZ4320164.1 YihY/virulence factor BrkB family protein [Aequorivita viscosa]